MSSVVPFLFCDIQSIEASVKSIVLPDWICNDQNCIEFDFSRFFCIESIEIGDGNFEFVKTFKIDGLNRLKTIKIGNNSFTQKKNDFGNDNSKSFHILNCESLESIEIGEYSFSDFGGEFELKNLPQLQSIQTVDNCFGSVKTFKIDGLNRLKTIKIGNNSFTQKKNDFGYDESKSFHILNCESLESIEIGEYSFSDFGGEFELKNLPQLQSIQTVDNCFGSVKTFKIDGLNRLKTIKIGKNSFTLLKESNWNYRKANTQSKSFHILNCESLESIQIGERSFSDFAGEFELKNLPQLQSIQMGTIGKESHNFYGSSFVIRGIAMTTDI